MKNPLLTITLFFTGISFSQKINMGEVFGIQLDMFAYTSKNNDKNAILDVWTKMKVIKKTEGIKFTLPFIPINRKLTYI